MPTIAEVYFQSLNEGKDKGVLSSDLRVLIAFCMGFREPIDTLLHRDEEMRNFEQFQAGFARLMQGEPVEYIIQEARFLEYRLHVDNRVLIPRMETQELIANITEKIYDYYDPRNFLVVADIGTGSGAIAIALKHLFPNWLLTASDISQDALDVAKMNIEKSGLSVRTLKGDALEPFIDQRMNLDIIVSNPPYILNREEAQPSVSAYEPGSALWLDKDHSVYESIFRDYKKVKKGTLLMCFEIGYDLEDYLKGLMARYLEDYDYEFLPDLNGLTRFLFVFCK